VKRFVALVVAALALPACGKPADAPKGPASSAAPSRKPKVTVETLALRELEYSIDAIGTIEAAEEISIPARVSGVIDALTFKEGDVVDETTVLCEIEVERYRLSVARAEAQLEHAKAASTLAETVHNNRQKLYEEAKLQKKDWVTAEQLAQVRADWERAKAEVSRFQAERDLAKRDHTNASVRPPIRGLINSKPISRGEYVTPGTVIATMLNVASLNVRFTLPELEASRLHARQEVTFAIRSVPDRTFKARLFYTSQKAEAATRAIECKAEILDKHEALRTGLFAAVTIVTAKQMSVVAPERAVLPTERGFIVFVVGEGNKVKARVVKQGLKSADGIEIIDGLAAGERIVVDGAATLRDGMEVDPVAPKPERPAAARS
jgi:membrane fusion protein, multidrug efflux system